MHLHEQIDELHQQIDALNQRILAQVARRHQENTNVAGHSSR